MILVARGELLMPLFFPTPYPDELLYSIIARYKKWSGEMNHRSILHDLFGNVYVSASMDLPSHIGHLVERLPITSNITVERLIQEHTMYPFYSAFLPPGQASTVFQSMAYGNGNDIYMRSGMMASSIRSNTYIRFCKDCYIEDIRRYGEGYWHRMHQIPGVDVCIEHETNLQDSNVRINQANKHEYIAADDENCRLDTVMTKTPSDIIEKHSFISKNIEKLLNHSFPKRPFQWFEQFYMSKLQNLGYANVKGSKVNQEKLCQDMLAFFGKELLVQMQSRIEGEDNWLRQITRKHRKSFHPIRHLLFLQFLSSDVEELFYSKESYEPFGVGPWSCLNPAAEHYGTNMIKEVVLTTCEKTKEPIGTFTCSCGFIYTRRAGDDPMKLSRVKQFGAIWEAECIRLSEAGAGLREIGRRLHADPSTIKKCLLGGFCAADSKGGNKNNNQLLIDQKEWKHLQENYSNLSKTELRKLYPALYIRLYRADRSWLERESPKPSKRTTTSSKVSWHSRDQEILREVKEAVSAIQNLEGKPKRISKSYIGYMIDRKALLERHLNKLPLTKEYLDKVLESEEEYRVRKIKWAIKELRREGKKTTKWQVLRKAGIRPEFVTQNNKVFL